MPADNGSDLSPVRFGQRQINMQDVVIVCVGKCSVEQRTEIQGYARERYGPDDRYAESGEPECSRVVENSFGNLAGILGIRAMEGEEKRLST